MEKSERLKMAINHLRFINRIGADKEVAAIMGADASNVSRHMKGKPEPSEKFLKRFCAAFEGIFNLQWLMTGEGEMLVTDGAQQDSKQEVDPDIIPNAAPSEEASEIEYAGENKNDGVFFRDRNGRLYISVPHVPYAAHGEYPNLSDSLEPTSEWGREIYEVDRKAYGKYISFDVLGNSMNTGMYGSLRDGDKVLVRELERDNWRTLRVGDHRFWVLVFGPSVLIKEITHFDPVTGIVTCHSLNPSPEYHDFDIPLDSVRNLYYVIRIKPREIAVI